MIFVAFLLLNKINTLMQTVSNKMSKYMAFEIWCGKFCLGKKTNVIRRSPMRSKNLSIRAVDNASEKESPSFFDKTYPLTTSPILAGRTLFIKRL